MAISHVQPLLLLLASLFFLPALCALDFKDCGKGSSPVDVTSVVDIGDTGSASFTISGSTSFTAHVEVFDSDQDMLMCLDFTSELASSANVLSA
ncbi:unnamed protein product [Arabis nemorensis]|uniref:MD-2-related lipid-recognition domain-containing protein n=1 Tax=Arabis nemorensis TaxID=586526 RepID=A0A565BHQ2_9BRAS|nr:unnamed protein product [Arabis nemorensis]